jgi:hypothetical protein
MGERSRHSWRATLSTSERQPRAPRHHHTSSPLLTDLSHRWSRIGYACCIYPAPGSFPAPYMDAHMCSPAQRFASLGAHKQVAPPVSTAGDSKAKDTASPGRKRFRGSYLPPIHRESRGLETPSDKLSLAHPGTLREGSRLADRHFQPPFEAIVLDLVCLLMDRSPAVSSFQQIVRLHLCLPLLFVVTPDGLISLTRRHVVSRRWRV